MNTMIKVVTICIFLIVVSSVAFPQEQDWEQRAKFLQISSKVESDYRNKVFLTDWVFKKSSRISRLMTNQIVTYTLQTKSPLLLLALMQVESSFDPTSISRKGALGLGQIMPKYHAEELKRVRIIKEARDLFDISTGVKAAEHIWGIKLLKAKGDIREALVRYYGARNRRYINRVLRNLRHLASKTEGL